MGVSESDDHDLLQRLRTCDREAFCRAYERYKHDVLRVAAGVLGARQRTADAWDVLHDVFVSLARTASSLALESNLRAYLTRAAANRARDKLRSIAPGSSADALDCVASPRRICRRC